MTDNIAPIEFTHAEFIDWAKANNFCKRLLAFLEDQGNFAGASPKSWQDLSRVGQTDEFKAQPSDFRRSFTIGTIGLKAYNVYVMWALNQAEAQQKKNLN